MIASPILLMLLFSTLHYRWKSRRSTYETFFSPPLGTGCSTFGAAGEHRRSISDNLRARDRGEIPAGNPVDCVCMTSVLYDRVKSSPLWRLLCSLSSNAFWEKNILSPFLTMLDAGLFEASANMSIPLSTLRGFISALKLLWSALKIRTNSVKDLNFLTQGKTWWKSA